MASEPAPPGMGAGGPPAAGRPAGPPGPGGGGPGSGPGRRSPGGHGGLALRSSERPAPDAPASGGAGSGRAGSEATPPRGTARNALRPDAEERRDNAVFEALLRALARPGEVRALPEPGPESLARALLDRECRAFAADPRMAALLGELGAILVPPEEACHAFLSLDGEVGLATLGRLPTGDPLHPERGATVVAPTRIGEGARLRLWGPGIEGAQELRLGGLHPDLWEARSRLCRYPLGVELVLVDGARLVALPRSTSVEVL